MVWLKKWYVWIPFLLLAFVFVYYFSVVLIYLFSALIISLMGNPIVRLLDKVRIWKLKLPHSFNALVALLLVVGIIGSILYFLIPVIIEQAQYLSSVDVYSILDTMKEPVQGLESQLREYKLLAPDDTIEGIMTEYVTQFLGKLDVREFVGSLFGLLGELSISLFSIIFLAYFFLRDDKLVYKGLTVFTPVEAHDEISRVLFYGKKMLSRYFIGLFLEQVIMMSLISTGMYIIGLPNAIFVGVIAGAFNIIPYLGPIIGAVIGSIIGLTTLPPDTFSADAVPLLMKMLSVFVVANLIDNFVLQPLIYSKSVKAHPIEIFLVVIMVGSIAGPFGMILAIPVYTLLRIIALEFFGNWSLIQRLTRDLDTELKRTKPQKEKTDD